jgi:excisionase family DNA binding protein
MSKQFFTLSEVAEMLGVHYNTVYRWVTAKKLPTYQFGRDLKVKKDDLDAFITSSQQE